MTRLTKLVAVTAAVLTLAACGGTKGGTKGTASGANSGSGKDKVTLTLNWVPYGEHAPFYYGVKKGIYGAHGIDLEIKPGTGSGNTIQQVAQQKTMFGWADTPPLAKGVSAGMNVKSVGVFLQKG